VAEPDAPLSPLWWLKRLDLQRLRRLKTIKRWDAYYRGEHPLLFVGAKFRDAFGAMFRPLADNWMPLVCDSPQERLHVAGFKFGDNTAGDSDAWYIWQANNLDVEIRLGFRETFVSGVSYLLVDPFAELGAKKVPSITVEHPEQVIVATSSESRRKRVAALKRWRDDDGRDMATVYLLDRVYKYERISGRWAPRRFEPDLDVNASIPNPLGDIPMIGIVNRDRVMQTEGVAEHDNVIPLQDAVNKLLCDMLVAAEFAAFRQRWATGLDIPMEDGKPVQPFDAAVNRIWINEKQEGKFGDFEVTPLENYVTAMGTVVQHLAAQSRTPPHYMLGQIANASGDALKAAETGLVSKVYERQGTFSDPLEEAERLAFKGMSDPRADDVTAEVVWGDPESRSESEHVDASVKKLAAGVPLQQIWLDLGYSPQKIERFREMLREQALEQAALQQDLASLLNAGGDPVPAPSPGPTPVPAPAA
jgi:hypothetical protein